MATAQKQSHVRHYLVVATGCMCFMMVPGVLFQTNGLFMAEIAATWGKPFAEIAMWITVAQLVMMVTLPIAGKLAEKFDMRIILSASVICAAIGELGFSIAGENLWIMYIFGGIAGIGISIVSSIGVPQLMNNWFKKNVGFMLGICAACTGFGAAIWNQVAQALITSIGYQSAYMVLGILMLVLCLPFTIFAVRTRPSDLGLKMYGEDNVEEAGEEKAPAKKIGVEAGRAYRSVVFVVLLIFILGVNVGSFVYQYLAAYARSLPLAQDMPMLAANLASAAAIGQACGKIVMGAVLDRTNRGGMIISMCCGAIGILMMWLLPSSPWPIYAGGFIYGFFYCTVLVTSPLITRAAFGVREYDKIYPKVAAFGSLASAFAASGLGAMVDMWGYSTVFIFGIFLMVLCLASSLYVLYAARKLEWKDEDGNAVEAPAVS